MYSHVIVINIILCLLGSTGLSGQVCVKISTRSVELRNILYDCNQLIRLCLYGAMFSVLDCTTCEYGSTLSEGKIHNMLCTDTYFVYVR